VCMAAEIQVDVAIREPWSSSGTCDDDAPRASCLLSVGSDVKKVCHKLRLLLLLVLRRSVM